MLWNVRYERYVLFCCSLFFLFSFFSFCVVVCRVCRLQCQVVVDFTLSGWEILFHRKTQYKAIKTTVRDRRPITQRVSSILPSSYLPYLLSLTYSVLSSITMSSTTPTKQQTNDATATSTATTTNTNWQSTVPQQYRTDEISKIATALSNLEQKHTSIQSKLGIATRFENMIFMSATSLNDYHKKIQKRLKKLQKTYTSGGTIATVGKGGDGNNNVDNDISNIQEEINKKKFNLRLLYGDTMRLIAENGKLVSKMNPKLINHIDRFNECSFEVGAISSELAIKVGDGKPIVLKQRSPQDTL